MSATPPPPASGPRPPASWLERLAGLVGLLVLVGVAAVLGYDGLIRARAPPDIVVEATARRPMTRGHLVMLLVRNQGGTPVADLVVEATATMADGRREIATLRLDQVAAGSQEEGGVVFTHEPQDLALTARSFTLP